jgi:DNA-binding NarL/FixJ family response regulator
MGCFPHIGRAPGSRGGSLVSATLQPELDRARSAFEARAWPDAFELFRACDGSAALGGDDLEAYGESAWWAGHVDVSIAAWQRAYAWFLDAGAPQRAGLVALSLALQHLYRAEQSLCESWLGRARRLLAADPESVAYGYLLDTEADLALFAGDFPGAEERAARVGEIGANSGDRTLELLSRFMLGRALVAQGRVGQGMGLLDEVMLSVVEGALSPSQTGRLYCHMISICRELAEYRRALEWTDATLRWCECQSGAGNFPPICRIHRAHLTHLRGHWQSAEAEAERACEELVGRYVGGIGDGWYAIAECRRRRGDLRGAQEAFERANGCGREPLPGLALLRLAQGEVEASVSLLRRALSELPANRLRRARLLPAAIEAAVAAGDLEAASRGADELAVIAADCGSSGLRADAVLARSRVALAAGDPATALDDARDAWRAWAELEMPYEAAMARTLIAQACSAAGDSETARLELVAAREAFAALGASRDVSRMDALLGKAEAPGGLTVREVEVLRLVAAGKTNREVARELHLSEKTVGRHLENVFAKLGVRSRAAAVAFAVEHGLIRRPDESSIS